MAKKINKEAVVDLEKTNAKYLQTLNNIIKLLDKLKQLHQNNIDVQDDIVAAVEVIKSYTGKELTEAKKIDLSKILNDVQEEISVVMTIVKDANSHDQKMLSKLEGDLKKLESLLIKLEKDLKELEKNF